MAELSLVDVINLKNNPSRESRLLVAEKVCDQFNARHLTSEETIVVTEIFRLLTKDAEVAIRQALSEKLKHNSRLPEDIAFILANDVMQVALPILQFSPVLSEGDLITIVRGCKELTKLLAVTKRDVITPVISKELLNKKQLVISESLLRNKGAFVATEDLQQVIADYGHVDSLISTLIERQQLPAVIAEKIISMVTGGLKEQLLKKYSQHTHAIQEAAEETHEQVMLHNVSNPANANQKQELVEHLFRTQKLNSSVVIRAICLGDIEFFITSMTKLTGWSRDRIEQCVKDCNVDALRRLYRAGGLPESIQDATLAVLVVVLDELRKGQKAGSPILAGRIIERVVSAGYDRTVNNMSYLLTLVGKKTAFATTN
jgi:uncharacterized protein (DUF2336 family)